MVEFADVCYAKNIRNGTYEEILSEETENEAGSFGYPVDNLLFDYK